MKLRQILMILVEWLVRRRSPALYTMRAGLILTIAPLAGGWVLDATLLTPDRALNLSFAEGGGPPSIIIVAISLVGLGLLVGGALWERRRDRERQQQEATKRVLVLEVRGLRDTAGTPLEAAVPSHIEGRRDGDVIDLRQIQDGQIVQPDVAIDKIMAVPARLAQRAQDVRRSDATIVCGGLAPVPLMFLLGVLLDDEGEVVLMDWDRHEQHWRALDGVDDGKRFVSSGFDTLPSELDEVALTVSVSYPVDRESIAAKMPTYPRVDMKLQDGSIDCHWSTTKQVELGRQFYQTVFHLVGRGANKIHLFLAAPNSMVVRFGRLYDRRNLPDLVVYQYEKAENPPHTWGIEMIGLDRPQLVQ